MESWYEITGKSIHVLWIEYCRDTNVQESYLEKVYETFLNKLESCAMGRCLAIQQAALDRYLAR